MEGTITSFNCGGCNKVYRWKPELAGKKVKCKCGHSMLVPAPAAAPVAAEPIESDDPFADALAAAADAEERGAYQVAADLPRCPGCMQPMPAGTVACMQCGYNVKTGKKPELKPDKAAARQGAAGPGGKAAAGVLPYRGKPGLPGRAEANNNVGDPTKDLFIPIGLFVLGVILAFIETKISFGIANYGAAFLVTSIFIVVNIVLVFSAVMMAVKMMDLGLGPIGPALIKIAVVAVLPGAVAGVMAATFGFGGGWFGRIAGLILTYALFMWLLELDYYETNICAVLIWLVRTFGTYLIIFALIGAMGVSVQNAAPLLNGGGKTLAEEDFGPYGGRYLSAKEMDALAVRLLASPRAMEARAWVAGGPEGTRLVPSRREMTPKAIVESIYALGAKRVTITKFKAIEGQVEEAEQLVIEMPTAKAAREDLIDWNDSLSDIYRYDSVKENGSKYIVANYDGQSLSELYDGSSKKKKK